MKNSAKIFILFVLALFILPLASAQFFVKTEKNSIDGVADGEYALIPAKIENIGQCKMDCFYMTRTDIKKDVGMLKPQQNLDFTINFQVHACGKDICEGIVDFICKDIPDNKDCAGQEHNFKLTFQMTNIKQGSSAEGKMPLENKDQGNTPGCYCNGNGNCEENECPECKDCLSKEGSTSESTSESSGFNADNVGEFIGIVFVIIVSIIFFILLIFGFYKLIRFLFFRKEKEEKERKEEEGKRKLSAIMFTDMKGYSAEMNRDEETTLKKLWRYEKAMKSIVKEYDGGVVKTIGDAIMGDFNSAVNAVKASIEIQRLLKKEDIKIRIGIHLGDVIHKGGDIFGDGVNIASRIESICEPGKFIFLRMFTAKSRGKSM